MTSKNILMMALGLLIVNASAYADPTNVAQQASGDCAAQIREAIAKYVGTPIDPSEWNNQFVGSDPKVWPDAANVIVAGFSDSNSCLNSFDATIIPTAMDMEADQTMGESSPKLPTATSCTVTHVEPDSNPVDCG